MQNFKFREIILFIFFSFSYLQCIDKNKSQLVPFFPISASSYSYEDLGLPSQPVEINQITLPIISNAESTAIEDYMKDMDTLGLMTDVALKQQSVEAWKNIQFTPMSNNEIDDKIYKEAIGIQVPPKISGSYDQLLSKESIEADQFFQKVEKDFPIFSNSDLITIRKKLTISLIMIRLQMDYGDKVDGIPLQFLKMIQLKTVAHRQKVTEEMIKRGIKSL